MSHKPQQNERLEAGQPRLRRSSRSIADRYLQNEPPSPIDPRHTVYSLRPVSELRNDGNNRPGYQPSAESLAPRGSAARDGEAPGSSPRSFVPMETLEERSQQQPIEPPKSRFNRRAADSQEQSENEASDVVAAPRRKPTHGRNRTVESLPALSQEPSEVEAKHKFAAAHGSAHPQMTSALLRDDHRSYQAIGTLNEGVFIPPHEHDPENADELGKASKTSRNPLAAFKKLRRTKNLQLEEESSMPNLSQVRHWAAESARAFEVPELSPELKNKMLPPRPPAPPPKDTAPRQLVLEAQPYSESMAREDPESGKVKKIERRRAQRKKANGEMQSAVSGQGVRNPANPDETDQPCSFCGAPRALISTKKCYECTHGFI